MTTIQFTTEEKEPLVRKIQLYFSKELNQEIGGFDAEFLLDFISREVGAYFYNRGLYDAQAALTNRLEDIQDSIFHLEKPTDFQK